MSTSAITAAKRTPWALRHGNLETIDATELLATAIEATREDRGIDPGEIDLLLVACDTSVGAKALNIARRAALDLGWSDVAALTVDGQRAAGLALVGLATERSGTTMIASIDCPTVVPPGADLVRDYGRPIRTRPEIETLENLAADRGLTRELLDEVAAAMREPAIHPSNAIASMSGRSGTIGTDDVDRRLLEDLEPLVSGGSQTAWHVAEYADGAAAVIVEHGRAIGRPVRAATVVAEAPERIAESLEKLVRNADSDVVMAESYAVVMAAIGSPTPHPEVASPLAVGSAPAGDGLRCLADAWHGIDEDVLVVSRGDLGQTASVTLGVA